MPGRVLNFTGEPIAVYGPNTSGSPTHDNRRYRLPSGRQTPGSGWDCDGVFVPNDRIARRLLFANRPGPVAIKYIDWQQFVIIRKVERGGQMTYQMPLDFGTWGMAESHCPTDPHLPGVPPARVCWEIPNESSVDIDDLDEVPGHVAAQCPWMLAFTGIERIDRLLAGDAGVPPIKKDDAQPDPVAIEFVQELLRGQDLRKVPGRKSWKSNPQGETFGTFGVKTEKAILHFKNKHQKKWGFPVSPSSEVDARLLRALLLEPASTPGAGRGYLMAVLNQPFSIWEMMVSLISTYEESVDKGGFAAQSPPGMDQAGLSYGLLQWTHRSERLAILLKRFRDQAPSRFQKRFTVQNTTLTELTTHAENPAQRLNADGSTKPAFVNYDLFSSRWRTRFHAAGLDPILQRLQVRQAVEDLKSEIRFMKDAAGGGGAGYATLLTSEWAVGFWLDLANQLGTTGAKNRYQQVVSSLGGSPSEQAILDKVVAESSFKDRREYFRDRAPLSKTAPFPLP